MPKKQVRASADAPVGAAALIEAKQAARKLPAPSSAALTELRKLCDYNDGVAKMALRVSATDAVAMLRSRGWSGTARSALDSVCREHLGRRSYGSP